MTIRLPVEAGPLGRFGEFRTHAVGAHTVLSHRYDCDAARSGGQDLSQGCQAVRLRKVLGVMGRVLYPLAPIAGLPASTSAVRASSVFFG